MKIGDKVRVRRLKDLLCAAPEANRFARKLSTEDLFFNPEMKKFCGFYYVIYRGDGEFDFFCLSSDKDYQNMKNGQFPSRSTMVEPAIVRWKWCEDWLEKVEPEVADLAWREDWLEKEG